jgi:3D (Asp-Asp-Asp) domain-containing protein
MLTNHVFDATTPTPIATGHPDGLRPIVQFYNKDKRVVAVDFTVIEKNSMIYIMPQGLLLIPNQPLTMAVMT